MDEKEAVNLSSLFQFYQDLRCIMLNLPSSFILKEFSNLINVISINKYVFSVKSHVAIRINVLLAGRHRRCGTWRYGQRQGRSISLHTTRLLPGQSSRWLHAHAIG